MITAAIWLLAVAWPTSRGDKLFVRLVDQALVFGAAILLTIAVNS